MNTGVVAFTGFHRSFYLRPLFANPNLSPLLWVHGFVFTGWLLVFLAQTVLAACGNIRLHRRFGIAAVVLAGIVLSIGFAAALQNVREAPPDAGPGLFRTLPARRLGLFAAFTGLAVRLRRTPESHKRLMVLGTASLLAAPFARLHRLFPALVPIHGPTLFCGGVDVTMMAITLADLVRTRRLRPEYLWGTLGGIGVHRLTVIVANTPAWLRLAHRLVA